MGAHRHIALAGPDRVGGAPPRRQRRAARFGRGGVRAALAVLLLAAAVGGQTRTELKNRSLELAGPLRAGNPAEREAAADGLIEIGQIVDERIASASSEAERGSYYYVAFATYRSLGRFAPSANLDQRRTWLARCVEVADVWGQQEAMCDGRYYLSEALLGGGRVREAREVLLDALRAAPDAKGARPAVLHGLAEAESRLASYDDALRRCDEAEAALMPDVMKALEYRIQGTRGQVYLHLGLPDRAAPLIESEAAGITELLSMGAVSFKDLIASDIHRANLAVASGNHAYAAELCAELLTNDDRYPVGSGGHAVLLAALGEARIFLEREAAAPAGSARAALLAALDSDLPELDRMRVETRLTEILLDEGQPGEATRYLDAARERLAGWQSAEAKPSRSPHRIHVAACAARLAVEGGAAPDELRACRDELASAFGDRVALWSSIPPRVGGLGFLHHPSRREWLSELFRVELAVDPDGGAQTALGWLMLAQAQGTLLRRLGSPEIGVEDVQAELLDAGRGVVALVPAPRRSHVFLIERGEVRHAAAAPEHVLNRLRLDHLAAIESRNPMRERQLARRLSEELLPGATSARVGGWNGITLVGAGLFGRLPFEYLPVGEAPYIGLARAVDRLPSLPLGVALHRRVETRGPAPELDLVLAAAPLPSEAARGRWESVAELPWTTEEEPILAAYRPGAAEALLRESVTVPGVFPADEPARARVLQVVAHTVLDAELERSPTLVLTPGGGYDGLVTCDAIEGVSAPELVVLTSCKAGSGPVRRGDEATGHMGGAFLFAGASTVLLSDQELFLGPATRFSAWFHERLSAGESPAEAARFARVKSMESGLFAVPTEAGLIYVLGLGQRPVFPERAVAAPPPAPEAPAASPELTPLGAGPDGTESEATAGEGASKSSLLFRVGIAFGVLALLLMLVSIALQRRSAARASDS
ncbi:MAG: CHAT domain-containing protein [Planctomycetota bacterium]